MMEKARKQREAKQEAKRSTGGKLKDKLLGSTKGEREARRTEKAAARAKQAEEERVSQEVDSRRVVRCLMGARRLTVPFRRNRR